MKAEKKMKIPSEISEKAGRAGVWNEKAASEISEPRKEVISFASASIEEGMELGEKERKRNYSQFNPLYLRRCFNEKTYCNDHRG
jgi:hypothetical protein